MYERKASDSGTAQNGSVIVDPMASKSPEDQEETSKGLTPKEIENARRHLETWGKTFGTQELAARALGIAQGTYSSYVSGKSGFGIRVLRTLANVSHILVDTLIGRDRAPLDIALAYNGRQVRDEALKKAEAALDAGAVKTPREWWAFILQAEGELHAADVEAVQAEQAEAPPHTVDAGSGMRRKHVDETTPKTTEVKIDGRKPRVSTAADQRKGKG